MWYFSKGDYECHTQKIVYAKKNKGTKYSANLKKERFC